MSFSGCLDSPFFSFSKPVSKFSFDASSAQRIPFGYSRDFNVPLIDAHSLAALPTIFPMCRQVCVGVLSRPPLQKSPWRQSLWNLTFFLRDIWSDSGGNSIDHAGRGEKRQNFGDSIGIFKGTVLKRPGIKME